MTNKTEILVLGDSHSRVLNYMEGRLPDIVFRVGAVGGATASGLRNPDANTAARRKYRDWLNKFEHIETVILHLGEIDCGYVIWWRAQKYNKSVKAMLYLAVSAYTELINAVLLQDKRVIVISAPLPTIQDGQDLSEVAGARKEVRASLFERTQLTILFNLTVQKWCQVLDVAYINLDLDLISEFGTVDEAFINPEPTDHHYACGPYADLLAEKLRGVI